MDSFGQILNVNVPVPYPKLPASPIGDGEAPVLAKDMGFTTEGPLADGSSSIDAAIRRYNAMLWQFRFNSIPGAGHRACSGLSVKPWSHEFKIHQAEYSKWAVVWQGRSYGNGKGERNWFPVFVEAAVSHHNYEAHIYNLKRLYWEHCLAPPAETAGARATRIAMRDSVGARGEKLQAKWVTRLESIMYNQRAKMKSISTAEPKGQMDYAREEAYGAEIGKELQQAKEYRPLATKPASNQLIPQARLYYRDMSAEARCDFWAQKWNLELALNIYDWATGIVAVEANFNDPKIGYFMETTFVNMAHWTWTKVVAPRRSNAKVAYNPIPYLRSAALSEEGGAGVYRRFRSINRTACQGGKDIGTIEDLWVHGYIGKKRKAALDSNYTVMLPKRRAPTDTWIEETSRAECRSQGTANEGHLQWRSAMGNPHSV